MSTLNLDSANSENTINQPLQTISGVPNPKNTSKNKNKKRKKQRLNQKKNLVAHTLNDFLKQQLPERDYLLEPVFPTQSLSMIYAPRGIGKTFFAMHLAYTIATDGNLFSWKSVKPRKVLYLDGEMPANVLQERFLTIKKTGSKKKNHVGNLCVVAQELQNEGMPDLASLSGQKKYNKLVKDVDLIIVDNISTLCRASAENNADEWVIVSEWLLKMRRLGKSVVLIHHSGKSGMQRGTSKREDILDIVIALKPTKDESPTGATFEVHFEKSRHLSGDQTKPFVASLQNGTWTHIPLEDDRQARIVKMHKDGLKQIEIAEHLGINKSTVSRCLSKAKREGITF